MERRHTQQHWGLRGALTSSRADSHQEQEEQDDKNDDSSDDKHDAHSRRVRGRAQQQHGESKFSLQEEHWHALSNLRVEQDQQQEREHNQDDDDDDEGEHAQDDRRRHHTRQLIDAEAAGEEDEAKGEGEAANADRVSKSSLSFILDDHDNNNNNTSSRDNLHDQSSAPSSVVSDSDYEVSSSYKGSESGQETKGDARRTAALRPLPRRHPQGAAGQTQAQEHLPVGVHHGHTNVRIRPATPSTLASAAGEGAAPQKKARRGKPQGDPERKARRPPSRVCKFDGCEQYVVDQGLCVRHGGGKRCQTEGCTSRAKHQGRCWRHGGSTECKVPSCINRAKSRGYCWSHGGGTKCKADTCEKIAISNGLCWAHGGGKRCIVKGCLRQAYERTNNYCNNHFQEIEGGTFTGEIEEDLDDHERGNQDADAMETEEKTPVER